MRFHRLGERIGWYGTLGEVTEQLRVKSFSRSSSFYPETVVTLGTLAVIEDAPLREVTFHLLGLPIISTEDVYEVTIRKVEK